MDWRLLVRVVVDGQDMSSRFRPMLSALSITDSVGLESDELRIDLALGGLGGRMPFPRSGASIEVWLGAGLSAVRMGSYIADAFEASGPPDLMSISAKAAVYDGAGGTTGLQTAKSRSWPAGTTVAELVGRIAQEHGLRPAVGQSIRTMALDHLDQVDESDINLLTRVARDLGAFVKPANASIVFARLGESRSASGQPIAPVTLLPADLSRWRVSRDARELPRSCVAIWRDLAAAVDREEVAGSGDPSLRLRHRFASQAAARQAADSALAKGRRGKLVASCELPGRADLIAEGRVILPALHPDLGREWLVLRVDHQLDPRGWRTSFKAQLPT